MKGAWNGRFRVKKLEKEKMWSTRTTPGGQHRIGIAQGATLEKGNGSNKEGYGKDEGEHEKDESCR